MSTLKELQLFSFFLLSKLFALHLLLAAARIVGACAGAWAWQDAYWFGDLIAKVRKKFRSPDLGVKFELQIAQGKTVGIYIYVYVCISISESDITHTHRYTCWRTHKSSAARTKWRKSAPLYGSSMKMRH